MEQNENKKWVENAFNDAEAQREKEARALAEDGADACTRIFEENFTSIMGAFAEAHGHDKALRVMEAIFKCPEVLQFAKSCFGTGYIYKRMQALAGQDE